MTTWYLDTDDEITDAVARLRHADTDAERVVFVVPPGSRIATGRVNFKLLAREAAARDLALAVASPDEQVRALAASAGVLAAATPSEAEAALERGDEPPPVKPASEDEPRPLSSTSPAAATAAGAFTWRSRWVRFATVFVLALVIIAGYVMTQVLPTAHVTLVPRVSLIGPLEIAVVASAETTVVDSEAGRIPAAVVSVPLEAADVYPASGSETIETRATGTVVFSSPDQEFAQEIAAGTRVATPAGIGFRTTKTVTLPVMDGTPARVEAPVVALEPGAEGNVPAEAISIVPSLEGQGIAVSNPEPTSGGRFVASSLVTAADYDAAAVDLRNRLTGELAVYLRDPVDAPEGSTVYPGTAVLGTVELTPVADEIVGQAASAFELTGAVTASVLAVDEAIVDAVVRSQLLAGVRAGQAMIDESVEVSHGEGIADGPNVVFVGTAAGQVVALVDPDALAEKIAGLPISDAQAILEELGSATVNVWPGFIGDLPNDRQRIRLDVEGTSATE
jgi:hypothetical protein